MSDFENYQLEGEELPIKVYPSPVLSKKAEPVTEFNEELRETVKNMLYTMYKAPGIGLAAPQVGISKRFFVMDVNYHRDTVTNSEGEEEVRLSDFHPYVFINPKIVTKEGEVIYEEGCLSVPGIYDEVKRAEKITVEYQNLHGETQTLDADELFAICIQHENDHLDGIVFLDRLSLIKKNLYRKKMLKQKKKG